MKLKKEDLEGVPCDMLSKNKAGNYVIRKGFYYRRGGSQHVMEEKLKEKFPSVNIVAFRGGDTIAQGSHWWVEFNFERP